MTDKFFDHDPTECPRCGAKGPHPDGYIEIRDFAAGTPVGDPGLALENPGLEAFHRLECRCSACNYSWACQPTKAEDPVDAEITRRFEYRVPNEDRRVKHGAARRSCLAAAREVMVVCPASRERDVAIMKLEEAMFWANAAIARRTP